MVSQINISKQMEITNRLNQYIEICKLTLQTYRGHYRVAVEHLVDDEIEITVTRRDANTAAKFTHITYLPKFNNVAMVTSAGLHMNKAVALLGTKSNA